MGLKSGSEVSKCIFSVNWELGVSIKLDFTALNKRITMVTALLVYIAVSLICSISPSSLCKIECRHITSWLMHIATIITKVCKNFTEQIVIKDRQCNEITLCIVRSEVWIDHHAHCMSISHQFPIIEWCLTTS